VREGDRRQQVFKEEGRRRGTHRGDALLVVVHGQHEPAHLVDEATDDLDLGLGLSCAAVPRDHVSLATRIEKSATAKGRRDDAPRDEKAWKYCATYVMTLRSSGLRVPTKSSTSSNLCAHQGPA